MSTGALSQGICSHNLITIMTASFGIGFFYGIIAYPNLLVLGAMATYFVFNKIKKTPEQIEQEENEKYLKE